MNGLPDELYQELRDILLTCGPFDDAAQLQAIFDHADLYAWRNEVPESRNKQARVDDLIHLLYNKRFDQPNPLIRFLNILSGRVEGGCKEKLSQLAERLTTYLDEVDNPMLDTPSPLVPLLPTNYIHRQEFAAIEIAIVAGKDRYYGITGISGSGKSILAAALTRSYKIQEAFDGRVFWVGMSDKTRERVADSSPIPYQEQLYMQLKGDLSSRLDVKSWLEGLTRLKQLVKNKFANGKFLLIVDDPPANSDVLEALEIHENVVYLVTTQDPSFLISQGIKQDSLFKLVGFTKNEATELLSLWTEKAKKDLPEISKTIAHELDYSPLALAMVGAVVKSAILSNIPWTTAWTDVYAAIEAGDLEDISYRVDKYPHQKLNNVIQLVIGLLEDIPRRKLLDLAMFPHGWRFEIKVFSTIWNIEKEQNIRKIIQNLVNAAILQPIGASYYVLHNLVRLYIRNEKSNLLHSYQNLGPLLYPEVPLPVLATVWEDDLALLTLIESNIDVDEPNPENLTALHIAAERGYQEIVGILLDAGAAIDKRGAKGATALRQAALSGHRNVVQQIIQRGANVDAQDDDGFTALHVVAQFNHLDIARTLLQAKATPNMPNKHRKSPLFVAAIHNNPDIVQALLRVLPLSAHETDPTVSALQVSAARGNVAVVRVLLEAGAEVNWSPPKNPGTALHRAAQNGHLDVVELLIKSRATPDIPGADNFTPLHIAAQEGHREIVSALLAAGANVNARAVENYTPLHLTAFKLDSETAQLLLAGGADVNLKRSDAYTALHIALKKRFDLVLSTAKMALSFSENEEGTSGVMTATVASHDGLPLIQLLLANGADPNLAGPQGNTPLHFAASNGDVEGVRLLLESGASPNLLNAPGKTPLAVAIEQSGNVSRQLYSRADYKGVIELLPQE